jgi:hypothetical protein
MVYICGVLQLVLKGLVQSQFLSSLSENWDQDWFLYFTKSTKTGPDPIGLVHIGYKSVQKLVKTGF